MKIGIISDIHGDTYSYETNYLELYKDKIDVLVIAGDIQNFWTESEFDDWCKHISKDFPKTIFVPGNHDLWSKDKNYKDVILMFETIAHNYNNIFVLNNNYLRIDNYIFVGSIYFSEPNNTERLNDFKCIKSQKSTIKKTNFIEEHKTAKKYISSILDGLKQDESLIAITHFGPSTKSIALRYQTQDNSYFCNADDSLIEQNSDKIKLWIHGHTHEPFDYSIRNTRIICNPLGYPTENYRHPFRIKIVEI